MITFYHTFSLCDCTFMPTSEQFRYAINTAYLFMWFYSKWDWKMPKDGEGDVTTKMDHLYGYQLMSKIKAFVSPFYDWHGLSGFCFPQYFFS